MLFQFTPPTYLDPRLINFSIFSSLTLLFDCLSKFTQADDSKSGIDFDHTNKDACQEDVSAAPDYSSEVPDEEGQNDNLDIGSQTPCSPAPQALDRAFTLTNGQRSEPRHQCQESVR